MGRAAACCSHDGGVAHGVPVRGDIFAPSRLRVNQCSREGSEEVSGGVSRNRVLLGPWPTQRTKPLYVLRASAR
jgi:hypothetical protein